MAIVSVSLKLFHASISYIQITSNSYVLRIFYGNFVDTFENENKNIICHFSDRLNKVCNLLSLNMNIFIKIAMNSTFLSILVSTYILNCFVRTVVHGNSCVFNTNLPIPATLIAFFQSASNMSLLSFFDAELHVSFIVNM